MDQKCLKVDSDFLHNERASRVDGGVDRISQLPSEILFVILSFLPVRKAAATTVLSSRWLDLWKQIPNLKFNLKSDRISQLPDNILLVILSSLTMKEVVATSVLSSRWSDLWKLTPSLTVEPYKFRHYKEYYIRDLFCNTKYIEVVNSLIRSHKVPSLEEFKMVYCVRESANCAVGKWLEFVSSRNVRSLVLNFKCDDDCNEDSMVVLEESLREMTRICGAPPTLIFFQSLESLHLDSLKVSGEDIKLFLRSCPLLRIMKIHSATLTSDFEVCGATDLMLKRLDILSCNGGKSVKVSAPNLCWITLDESSWKLLCEINAPQLLEADFTTGNSDFVVQDCIDEVVELVTYIWDNCVALRKVILGCIAWPRIDFGNAADMQKTRKQILIQELRARVPNHIPLQFCQAHCSLDF